jgi:CHAT domain-containing protein
MGSFLARAWLSMKPRAVIIAIAFLLACATLITYKFFSGRAEEGEWISLLKEAYKGNRSVQSRIADFDYAPFITTRGGVDSTPDTPTYDRTERVIHDAVYYHPGAKSYRALGILHLMNKRPDKAIKAFEEALSYSPSDARLHSDLGAALLEKGKTELEKERLQSKPTGKPIELLSQSFEHIHRALDLDASLKVATFNLGLLQEQAGLHSAAVDTLSKYLEVDAGSEWADEARERITIRHESEAASPLNEGGVLADFLDAFQKKDEARAWELICSNRSALNGKYISELLVDAYIDQSLNLQRDAAANSLSALYFLAEMEARRVDEHYSEGLAAFYKAQQPAALSRLKKARELVRRGHSLYLLDKNVEAAGAYAEAKKEFDALRDRCESLSAEYRVAYCDSESRETEKSLPAFERLAALCEGEKFKLLYASSLLGIASDEFSQKKYSKAIGHASRSLEVSRQSGDKVGAFSSLECLTVYYRTVGNNKIILTCIQDNLEYCDCPSLNQLQSFNHYSRAADALFSAGYVDSSLEYRKEASRFLTKDVPRNAALYSADLGATYSKLKKYDEALANLNRGYEEAREVSPEPVRDLILVYVALHKGNFYKSRSEFQNALADYTDALNLSRSVDFPAYAYEARKGRLSSYIALAEDEMAENEIAEMLKLLENARSEILEQENRNTFFDAEQDVYDLAIDYECSRRNDFLKALEYSEESRSRSLLDLLKTQADVVSNTRALDIKFKETYSPLTIPAIQAGLPERLQVIHYCVLGDKIITWVISPDSVSHAVVDISQDELNKKVKAYVDAISHNPDKESAGLSAQSKGLYDILIKPVAHLLNRDDSICIMPDKVLNILPFEALVSAETQRYLVEDFSVIYSTSSSVLLACVEAARGKAAPDAERLLGVGDPSFDHSVFKDLPGLSAAKREVEKIAAFYPQSVTLTAGAAREAAVKSEMRRASVIHFATHSILDEDSPLLSKILLAKETTDRPEVNDGVLQSYEIYNTKFPNAALVVLSSCQSGIDRYYKGEGMMSLARSFMAAGVPTVVASLWKADSDATANLMIEFHRLRRQEHLSVVESLRRAKLNMIRGQDGRFRSPYFWSAFIVTGGEARFDRAVEARAQAYPPPLNYK